MENASSPASASRLKRAGLEVAVIVLGILLALAADAWWDERIRQDREFGLLLALQEEFEANAAELEQTGRAHLALLEEALLLLEQNRAEPAVQDGVSRAVAGLLSEYRTDLNNGVLNGYLATADPELLRNDELRSALAAWPAVIDQLWQEELRARRLVDEEIAPFLVENGDLAATFRITDGFTSAGRDRLVPIRVAADSANRNADILGYQRFLNLVAWKIRAEREALYKHEQVSIAHDALLASLNAEIARLR
jgi:hypothetical protein